MEELLSGPIVEIVVTLVGLAWAFFKSTEWYKDTISTPRREKAIESVQAGVAEVYDTYTREIKAASADGHLSPEERKKARQLAKEAAIKYGKANGVDIIKILGQEFIDLYLERAHKDVNADA